MKMAMHGNRELRAEIVDKTWVRLRTVEDGDLFTLSLVETTELIELLRGQVRLLAFGMGRSARRAREGGRADLSDRARAAQAVRCLAAAATLLGRALDPRALADEKP